MKNPFPPLEAWTRETFKRAASSKTVLAIAAGMAAHWAIRKGLIPNEFFTNAVAGACDLLAILFRVSATTDLKTGGELR